jgi:ribosomal protein S18 acetylase RimI-like enzyme
MTLPASSIREMTEADLDAASKLAEELVQLHHAWDRTRFFTSPDIAKGYRWWFSSQLGKEGVLLLVAEVEGAIAGYLYGTMEERDWAKLLDAHGAIHDIHVSAAHRRQGTAQALMNEARVRFQAQGAKQLVLYSASENVQGQTLFKKLGFRPTMVEMTMDLP